MKKIIALSFVCCITLFACKKDKPDPIEVPDPPVSSKNLVVKFRFDSTQVRLDNLGNESSVPTENSAQSPIFHGVSAHYLELTPTAYTMIGDGEILYKSAKTTLGGDEATHFDSLTVVDNEEVYLTIPLSNINPGTYKYLRVSVTYQNYDIDFRANGFDLTGRLTSFVGDNTYITTHTIKDDDISLNSNKKQGYWAFETDYGMSEGQAPEGATSVPNPIASTSPIPPGSCLVTGEFASPFTFTGDETEDIELIISLSTNKSFEWKDDNQNGIYEPLDGDTVVDMGLRGLIPIIN